MEGEFDNSISRTKILILTLGSGRIELDKVKEDAGYKMTQYTIEGKPYRKHGVEKKTSFVAEPIINHFEPDVIFFLGTVKSVWHQFYAATTTNDNYDISYRDDDYYKRLVEIETQNGINTGTESLKGLEEEITDIYRTIKGWKKYSDKYQDSGPDVHVLLTKYGINSDELKENYGILKRIETCLDADTAYEVAFDITHSFRSLPIYNLVIFNYIKNVTKHDIVISNVYYGNIDASHELGGKAPIVDLKDLVDVLNLTNGVTEFKNTGNAVSLLALTDAEEQLRDKLRDFDFATQLNAFGEIKQSLIGLETIVEIPAPDNRYTGVREMIKTVLHEKFKMGKDDSFSDFSDADLKFMLTGWFFNQNRMGLGLATGLEALRDINTPAFMAHRGFSADAERQYRESAESYFIMIAERLSSKFPGSLSSLEEVVCFMGTNLRRYKDIRNMFAHSLTSEQEGNTLTIKGEIESFKENLLKLKTEYDANRNDYIDLFRPDTQMRTNEHTTDDCRIVLQFSETCNPYDYQSSGSKHYDVYYLSTTARTSFFRGINGNRYSTTEKAYFLSEYLKVKIPDGYKNIQIIICDCPDLEKEIVFRAFLEQIKDPNKEIGLYHLKDGEVRACRKTRLHIAKDIHQDELSKREPAYSQTMEEHLRVIKWSV